ncbi:MAG: hypothetical protein ACM3U1_01420 [Chloroflexota bacterium]
MRILVELAWGAELRGEKDGGRPLSLSKRPAFSFAVPFDGARDAASRSGAAEREKG